MKRTYKFGIVIGLALMLIGGLSGLTILEYRSWVYPIAAPMPAIVNEPMSGILSRLDGVIKTNAPHVAALLQPGLTAVEISKLEDHYQVHLPDDIREIYEWHNGSRLSTNYLSNDFIPGHRFLPLGETLEEVQLISNSKMTGLQRLLYGVLVGHRNSWTGLFVDGSGDGYWFDPKRKPSEGAVFFNFNETASYVFFPSAKNLMAGVTKCYESGAFHLKAGSSPPQLDENYDLSEKIWNEFGVSRD